MRTENLFDELFKEIDRWYAAGKRVERDDDAAAEARAWLEENEDDTQMTPERMAALEAAAAEDEVAEVVLDSMLEPAGAGAASGNGGNGGVVLDESVSPVAGRRFSRS